ncbi:MAG: outer membrane beta-barrel protein [Puia sp.]|nr:outer membrane beta-barrel protein [Puia sp.]
MRNGTRPNLLSPRMVLLSLAMGILVTKSEAQTSIELIPSAGYTFASRTDFYNSYGRTGGAFNFGGSVQFNVSRGFGVELMYNHMNTNTGLYQYGYNGTKLAGGDLALDYYMLGLVQSFTIPNSTVRPFIGLLLGAANYTPGGDNYSDETKFAWGLELGTNVYITDRIGLRLKAQLLSPVDAAGDGYYYNNYGSASNQANYPGIYQFSLSGGLIIGLGRVLPRQTPRPNYRPRPRYYYRYPPPPPPYY